VVENAQHVAVLLQTQPAHGCVTPPGLVDVHVAEANSALWKTLPLYLIFKLLHLATRVLCDVGYVGRRLGSASTEAGRRAVIVDLRVAPSTGAPGSCECICPFGAPFEIATWGPALAPRPRSPATIYSYSYIMLLQSRVRTFPTCER
jgi:hypothetical protein